MRKMIMGWFRVAVLVLAISLAPAPRAAAVSWDDPASPPPGDPDFAAAGRAFEQGDWKEAVAKLTRVVEKRPWNDEAHNRLGFAFRKLGEYSKALEHYGTALELNPYHRGALEYLGETYLEMNDLPKAEEVLRRLEAVCRRVLPSGPGGGGEPRCEEWRELSRAIAARRGRPGAD